MWIYPMARRQAGLDISLTKETKNTGTQEKKTGAQAKNTGTEAKKYWHAGKKYWHRGKKYWHRGKKRLAGRHAGLEATEATSATL